MQNEPTYRVECFDDEENKWFIHETGMTKKLAENLVALAYQNEQARVVAED